LGKYYINAYRIRKEPSLILCSPHIQSLSSMKCAIPNIDSNGYKVWIWKQV
jgi:hypothetical protein